jgi:hypothetical protein
LFQDPVEADLLAGTRAVLDRIGESEARADAGAILRALSSLADPIDAYFERVLVNCDDPAVRANRHGLLAAVYTLFGRYADFWPSSSRARLQPPDGGRQFARMSPARLAPTGYTRLTLVKILW